MKKQFDFVKSVQICKNILLDSLIIDFNDCKLEKQAFF